MKIVVSILTLIFCLLVFVAVNPKLRNQAQQLNPFKDNSRNVVAVVEGDFGGHHFSFYKLQTLQGVILEVYEKQTEGLKTVQKIELPQLKDGILEVQKSPTRMIITDFDKDGENELLVPLFDNQMRPLLYVYKFNAQSGQFDQISP